MYRLPGGNLFASASSLGASCKYLQIGRHEVRGQGGPLLVSLEQMGLIIQTAGLLKAASAELGMVACAAAASELGDAFKRLPRPSPEGLALNEAQLDDLIGNMEYLLRTFRDEIDARPLFALPPASAELYDQKQPLFGMVVDDAFPSSAKDVAEAGRCMAMGRWTAGVMHLMRALETPLALLAEHVGVAQASNWNRQLNEIEKKLRTVSTAEHGPGEEQWAAHAASHFRAIKNAWRNRAMHGRDFYDQERATEIYEAVRALMRHLAGKLSEDV